MSLFSDVGRKFEKTKQAVLDDAQIGYVCRSCEASVDDEYTYCPHCGAEAVEPVE